MSPTSVSLEIMPQLKLNQCQMDSSVSHLLFLNDQSCHLTRILFPLIFLFDRQTAGRTFFRESLSFMIAIFTGRKLIENVLNILSFNCVYFLQLYKLCSVSLGLPVVFQRKQMCQFGISLRNSVGMFLFLRYFINKTNPKYIFHSQTTPQLDTQQWVNPTPTPNK